jgi:D-alanyl-D-alanine carboxypeptidase
MSRVAAAGSLYPTVLDLNRWYDAVFAGKVISAASLETAVTVGVLEGDDPTYPERIGYGLGFEIAELNGEQQIGHGGELDGFGSSLIRLPRHRITVILLHNCVPELPGGQQWTLSRDIARLTLGDSLPEERPPQIDAGVPLSTLDEVVGRYDLGNNLVLTIARDGSRLFGAVTGRARMELFPKSERSFFIGKGEAEATFVKGPHGEIIKAILKQAGGRIDAWKMPVSSEAP